MANEKLYDFYYSKEMEEFEKELGELPSNIMINGKWYVFTECVEHGLEPISKRGKQIYVGTNFNISINLKYRQKVEGVWRKKLVYTEIKCDGYCQLCNLNCYTESIEDVKEEI